MKKPWIKYIFQNKKTQKKKMKKEQKIPILYSIYYNRNKLIKFKWPYKWLPFWPDLPPSSQWHTPDRLFFCGRSTCFGRTGVVVVGTGCTHPGARGTRGSSALAGWSWSSARGTQRGSLLREMGIGKRGD